MPATVNGIGTRYVGRKEVQTRPGVCEACGRGGELSSYNTRLWFTIVFIPVIPLGKKRVLDQCPACSRHRVLSLAEWERIKKETLEKAVRAFQTNPNDPAAAIDLHKGLLSFGQRAEADKLAHKLGQQFANDAKVQAYLGSALQYLGRATDALPFFQRALALDPQTTDAKLAVGVHLAQQGQIEAARKLLGFLETPGHGYGPGGLYVLATAYSNAGNSREAVTLFEKIITQFPAVAQDKAFRRAMKGALAAAGERPAKMPARPYNRKKIIGWTGAAAAILTAALGSNYYIAGHRTVHVVSGATVPITVSVDGQAPVRIGPRGSTELTLAEGRHRAEFHGGAEDTVEFTIGASFFDRWFRQPAWILNAGGSALLVWEETQYAAAPDESYQSPYRLHFGANFISHPHVDYLFEPFPQKLTLDSRSSHVSKTRIGRLDDPALPLVEGLWDRGRFDEALALTEWSLKWRPADVNVLGALITLARKLGREPQAKALLGGGLGRRPVEIEWHRFYQEITLSGTEGGELIAEYDRVLANEPANSTLQYLRGRLSRNGTEAMEFYRRALELDPANAYAYRAIAFRHAAAADWQAAVPPARRAYELSPGDASNLETYCEALSGQRDFTTLTAELLRRLEKDPFDQWTTLQLVAAYERSNQPDASAEALNNYEKEATRRLGSRARPLVELLRREAAYVVGDFPKLERLAGTGSDVGARFARFRALVETGRLDEASTLINEPKPTEDPFACLVLSAAWHDAGNREQATTWRDRAVVLLAKGRPESRWFAGALTGSEAPPLPELLDLAMYPQSKAIALVVLAQRFPDSAVPLLYAARNLNVGPAFPYHLLRRLTH